MNRKAKGGLLIFLMAITFYMMLENKYTGALGDYVLEFMDLRSWTGDNLGLHLTVVYFGILFLILLFLVNRYALDALNISGIKVFMIFVALIIVFSSITGIAARSIKKNSTGVMTIGYNASDSGMSYISEDGELVEFSAEFELTNYSDEKRSFHICIDNPFYRSHGYEEFSIYSLDGEPVTFVLEGKETRAYSIDLDDYAVVGGDSTGSGSGSSTGFEIILTDDEGNKVRLDGKNFFGVELSK